MALNERKLEAIRKIFETDDGLKRELLAFLRKSVVAYERVVQRNVDTALARLRNGRDGKPGPRGEPGRPGRDGEDGEDGKNGRDGSPDSPQDILRKLLAIKLPWLTQADKNELKGLIEKAAEEKRPFSFGAAGGGRGFYVYIDGLKKGIVKEFNFVGGVGMAIAYSEVLGRPTLTLNATGGGSGGITVETPPEEPDASRVEFTASDEPKYVIADGATYVEGHGYSYAAPLVTMSIPPSQSIRLII